MEWFWELFTAWRVAMGPSRATRRSVAAMLEGRHRQLLALDAVADALLCRGATMMRLEARVRTFDGYEHTEYFLVDIWDDAFSSRPRIREQRSSTALETVI
jgi:hypothetical protein